MLGNIDEIARANRCKVETTLWGKQLEVESISVGKNDVGQGVGGNQCNSPKIANMLNN